MDGTNKRSNLKLLLLVFGLALAVNLGLAFARGLNRPMESDSFYFLAIAKSLAQGHGYFLQEGFWPQAPTMSRSPAWPFVVSLALRLAPGANADGAMRLVACGTNALAAALVAQLAWVLFGRRRVAVGAGAVYAIYPVALYEASEGTSEVLFTVLVLAGTLFLLGARWRPLAGLLLLGCAALARPNFVTWIGFAGVLWVWQKSRHTHPRPLQGGECETVVANEVPSSGGGRETEATLGVPLLGVEQETAASNRVPLLGGGRGGFAASIVAPIAAVMLFLLPSSLWAARNYRVCGHFPVLSTLRGQTFYGGNNDVVADTLEWWGYWVFPNSIPGEPTMYALSRSMSEYEVDAYYFDKGKAWVRQHRSAMPRLVLGKLIRAYVPVPWRPSAKSWAVAACRGLLYLLGAVGLWLARHRLSPRLWIALVAMALANVLTVVAFWGCARFAFELEPLVIPFAIAACFAPFLRIPSFPNGGAPSVV